MERKGSSLGGKETEGEGGLRCGLHGEDHHGAPGIGPKTAAQLLNQYGNLEHLLSCMHELPEKTKVRLEPFRGRAGANKELVTLCRDVPVKITKEDMRYKGMQAERLHALFETYEMKTLAAQMMQAMQNNETTPQKTTFSEQKQHEEKKEHAESKNTQLELL